MSMKLLGIERLLTDAYGAEVTRYVTDYQKEHDRILEKRKAEFSRHGSPLFKKIKEENFHYATPLETMQTYHVPAEHEIGNVRIEVERIPVPVSEDTQVEIAEISFPAHKHCSIPAQ